MIVMTAEQAVDLDNDIQSHEKDSAPTTVFFSKVFLDPFIFFPFFQHWHKLTES